MLSLREKILLLLYLSLEEWGSGLEVLYHPYSFFYTSFSRGYKQSSVRQRLWEMAREGSLKKTEKGSEDAFQISPQGKEWLKLRVPLLRFRRRWDGRWRLVIFDIAESSRLLRDSVRRKLKELGFGRWQRSIWLTPFDVAEEMNKFLESLSLKGPVEVLEARRLFVRDEKELAEKAWRLDKLNGRYRTLVKEWEEGKARCKRDLPTLRRIAASLQDKYLAVLYDDPGLPAALLPKDWKGKELQRLLREWISLQG